MRSATRAISSLPSASGEACSSSAEPSRSALTRRSGAAVKRAVCRSRAAATRAAMVAELSPGSGQVEVGKGHGRNLDPQVEAVHQRAGNAAQVVLAADRSAAAGAVRVGQIAAFAGVGGGDQQEPAGIADMGIGAGDHDRAGLDRLAQRVEHGAGKFGEFVEEEDAVVGKADLARLRAPARRRRWRPSRRCDAVRGTGGRGRCRLRSEAPPANGSSRFPAPRAQRAAAGCRAGARRAWTCPSRGADHEQVMPPAAAISSARLARSWPFTSRKSRGLIVRATSPASAGIRGLRPV
jgi:hypothetical protein